MSKGSCESRPSPNLHFLHALERVNKKDLSKHRTFQFVFCCFVLQRGLRGSVRWFHVCCKATSFLWLPPPRQSLAGKDAGCFLVIIFYFESLAYHLKRGFHTSQFIQLRYQHPEVLFASVHGRWVAVGVVVDQACDFWMTSERYDAYGAREDWNLERWNLEEYGTLDSKILVIWCSKFFGLKCLVRTTPRNLQKSGMVRKSGSTSPNHPLSCRAWEP